MKGLVYVSGLLVLLFAAACNHHHNEEKEPEAISITKWTGKTELFVEFAPLLVGKETSFAAHLTDLETFKPVTEGTLRVSFIPPQGKAIVAEVKNSTVPGIYRPVAKIDQPGSYRLAFHRYRPGAAEVYDTIGWTDPGYHSIRSSAERLEEARRVGSIGDPAPTGSESHRNTEE